MSLLFDQNLSRRLVTLLASEYPGSKHVGGAGLLSADDMTVWRYASGMGLMIVSKDSDFRHMALVQGPPPKVISLRIVTCNDHVLRFEGFSACCGVYVRADFADESFDRPIVGRGTTSVDFGNDMRSGLTRLRSSHDASITVGAEKLSLRVDDAHIVEKKVKLPLRWIKSFCETTVHLPSMRQKFTVRGSELVRFVRSVARDPARARPRGSSSRAAA